MKIFIINGVGGCGKTTFENYVINYAKKHNKKIGVTSIIDIVKHYATLMGWNGQKEEKDRKFLCDLKKCLTEWDNIPIKSIEEDIKVCEEEGYDGLFIDMRELEDINIIKNKYNAITILVRNMEREKESYGNYADDSVLKDKSKLKDIYNIEIINNSDLKELYKSAKFFYENVIDCEEEEDE